MPSDLFKLRSWGKLLRYARLYGARRAAVKAAGRGAPIPSWAVLPKARGKADISVIGCGQAAFGTLCFFLREARGQSFLHAYDPTLAQAERLAKFYGFEGVTKSADALLADPRLRIVYISSNHASHASYAVDALNRGLDVFVEKPIATNWEDLRALEVAASAASGQLFTGYNRPFAPAIKVACETIRFTQKPVSLRCTVHGHTIPPSHWYRRPQEGTRICGNAGHWIDLFIHLIAAAWGGIPDVVSIQHAPHDTSEPDDNYRLELGTPRGDFFALDFSSLYEPAEGVYERIELDANGGDMHVVIDDFREMSLDSGDTEKRTHYRPKDVGHRSCTLQPWLPVGQQRKLEEVWRSARLILYVADLARRGGAATVDISATPAAASFGST